MSARLFTAVVIAGALLFGVGCDDADWAQDAELMKRAENGDADAQNNLGRMYYQGEGVDRSYEDAVKWYRKAAEQGDALAQHRLGWMYAKGQGVAQDNAEAVKWFRKAAEQGLAKAQTNLGLMYRNGEGVAENLVLAHMWMNLAGAQGLGIAREHMEFLVKKMTKKQIAEAAQKVATEWQEKHRSLGE